jgi:hypothetical protein
MNPKSVLLTVFLLVLVPVSLCHATDCEISDSPDPLMLLIVDWYDWYGQYLGTNSLGGGIQAVYSFPPACVPALWWSVTVSPLSQNYVWGPSLTGDVWITSFNYYDNLAYVPFYPFVAMGISAMQILDTRSGLIHQVYGTVELLIVKIEV